MNNMSEVGKICYKLRNNQCDEAKVSEIYHNIDSHSGEDRTKIAMALKDVWINGDKWDKKKNDLSRKQEDKVKKIKSILNE